MGCFFLHLLRVLGIICSPDDLELLLFSCTFSPERHPSDKVDFALTGKNKVVNTVCVVLGLLASLCASDVINTISFGD